MTRQGIVHATDIDAIIEARGVSGPRVGPVMLVVGGQIGSARTGALEYLAVARFGAETTQVADIDPDEPDCREALVDHAMSRQANIVLRVTNYDEIGKWMLKAVEDRRYGHVELCVLAANAAESWPEAVIENDCRTEDDMAALKSAHDAGYIRWAEAVVDCERMKWMDRVSIARPDGRTIYENSLIGDGDGPKHWDSAYKADLALLLARSGGTSGESHRSARPASLRPACNWARAKEPPAMVLPLYGAISGQMCLTSAQL
jgi:hypothetical protein